MTVGERVGGHFEILEKLGAGGMGDVWKARDTRLNRIVAIKEIRQHTERFEREARAVAALNHPNICGIYDVGAGYLVMEYVDGAPPRRPLPLNEALRLGAQVADALAAAHAAGITHRDLKPENILVTKDKRAKVLDFGLAKMAETSLSPDDTTNTMAITDEGTIMGTAAYMSPEQAEGKAVSPRSDIFSLGAVLYELVTGRRAFSGDSKMSILAAVLREEPKPVSEVAPAVPPEVGKLIARMMRKDPARRVQSMADVKLMLEELLEDSASGTAPAMPVKKPRWPLAAGLAAMMALAGGAYWMNRPAATPVAATAKLVQVTSFSGIERDPALSPDGRHIAFVWDGDREGGQFDVYVKLVDAGTPIRLTNTPENEEYPAWSPDGNYVAYARRGTEPGIYVAPALGGAERKVTSLGPVKNPLTAYSGPDWSADGKSILYPDRSVEPAVIRSVAVDGSVGQQVTKPPAGSWGDLRVAASPDGALLAVHRILSPGDLRFVILRSDGNSLMDFRAFRSPTINPSFTWTPDSRSLVYAIGGRVTLAPVDGAPPVPIPEAGSEASQPHMARRGNRLAFVTGYTDSNIWRANLGTPGADPVRVIASSRLDGQPDQPSEDGRIVFNSSRSGSSQVWIANADGSNAVQLTNAETPAAPRLSPNGQWVAFAARPDNNVNVYVVDAKGGAPRALAATAAEEHSARFSRDSQWVYYCAGTSGRREVWKRRLDGTGDAQQVTKNGGWVSRESVDGRWLYFSKDGSPSLYRMPVSGGAEEVVVAKSAYANWDVGAEGIYFVDGTTIWFHRFADRVVKKVLDAPKMAQGASGIALSADEKSLLFTRVDARVSDIMMLDGFQPLR